MVNTRQPQTLPLREFSTSRHAGIGLSPRTVDYLCDCKGEPDWLRQHRHRALTGLEASPSPAWHPKALAEIPLDSLCYYSTPASTGPAIQILDSLGIQRERADFLAGLHAQIDGEVLQRDLDPQWSDAGVILTDSTRGLTEFAPIFSPYFQSLVAPTENFFTRLNAAFFSGGAFIYVPPGVRISAPLKCFMHLQQERGTQAGRTLVILDEGAELTFMESCTSTLPPGPALHCSVGEFILGPRARMNYVGLQNWGAEVFNLAILRARLAAGASIHWIDCNLGGRLTMKYPCTLLEGEGASAEALSISVAHTGQSHDTGAKMFHRASRTSSTIVSKSVSHGRGRADYRGWVSIPGSVEGCRNHTECDALLLDPNSRADTYPAIQTRGGRNITQHEASVSRLSRDQIFYMRQRGLSESAARSLSVNGFVNDLVERFPFQYSLEIKRLIDLEMSGSVG